MLTYHLELLLCTVFPYGPRGRISCIPVYISWVYTCRWRRWLSWSACPSPPPPCCSSSAPSRFLKQTCFETAEIAVCNTKAVTCKVAQQRTVQASRKIFPFITVKILENFAVMMYLLKSCSWQMFQTRVLCSTPARCR